MLDEETQRLLRKQATRKKQYKQYHHHEELFFEITFSQKGGVYLEFLTLFTNLRQTFSCRLVAQTPT